MALSNPFWGFKAYSEGWTIGWIAVAGAATGGTEACGAASLSLHLLSFLSLDPPILLSSIFWIFVFATLRASSPFG